jgi:general stress protein 26
MAVQASVSPSGTPQAAVVGIVVTEELHVFFDTLDASRKAQNLRRNSKIAFVIGGPGNGEERTVQYEGLADEPGGEELERLKDSYFSRFPDGRERQRRPGLIYVRVRPAWIRYSDYSRTPPEIVRPIYQGKHGHPILLSADAIDAIHSLPASASPIPRCSRRSAGTLQTNMSGCSSLPYGPTRV